MGVFEIRPLEQCSIWKRGPKTPPQNPKYQKKHRVYTNFFEEFARMFAFFPVTQVRNPIGETLKGLYLKGLLSKHRSIACPLPLALASDLPCGVCTCKWDLQLPSPVRLWADFPRPRGWRVTTALGNPFPCRTALGNPFPYRKVCFAQKAPLDKPPLRLPDQWKLFRKTCSDKPFYFGWIFRVDFPPVIETLGETQSTSHFGFPPPFLYSAPKTISPSNM